MTQIIIQEGDKFIVTGKLRNGKRFKAMHFSNWRTANSINLWQGHVLLLRNGKRTMIKSVVN